MKLSKLNFKQGLSQALIILPAVLGAGQAFAATATTTTTVSPAQDEAGKVVQTLTQWEIDASFLLSQAIDNVKNPDIRKSLMEIKQHNESAIQAFTDWTRKMGKEPPAHSRDFKGYFMQGYATLRGLTSDKGTLEAVHSNALLAMKGYESALRSNLTPEVKTAIQNVFDVKKKDFELLETWISKAN